MSHLRFPELELVDTRIVDCGLWIGANIYHQLSTFLKVSNVKEEVPAIYSYLVRSLRSTCTVLRSNMCIALM